MFRSTSSLLLCFALAAMGSCGPQPPPGNNNTNNTTNTNNKTPPADPCEAHRTDDFAVGVIVNDNPRWFRPFEEGCNKVEMETGLQGGWHIEPAMQAPRDAVQDELQGSLIWSVSDEDGEEVARAELELFKNFWVELEGGLAYWGDFVIFRSNPEDLVGTELTIRLEVTFDEGGPDDFVREHTVDFVDEKENTVFR